MVFKPGHSYGGSPNSGRPRKDVTQALFGLFPKAIDYYRAVLDSQNTSSAVQRLKYEVSRDIIRKFAPDLSDEMGKSKLSERIGNVVEKLTTKGGDAESGRTDGSVPDGVQG